MGYSPVERMKLNWSNPVSPNVGISRRRLAREESKAQPRPSSMPMKPKKKDSSVRIQQRAKIGFDLQLRPLNWTEKQKLIIELAKEKGTRIVILKGPAGCSKTSLAMYISLELLNDRKVSDITLIRSAVESSDSKLGFLPGDVMEKFGVYLTPFHDKLEMFLSQSEIKELHEDKRLISMPVNFVRGNEWNVKAVVIDEAQNMTAKELKTLVTRMGEYSKLIICADPEQSDLPPNKSGFNALWDALNDKESNMEGIYCVEFTEDEIMRSAITKFLVKKLKGLK